MVGIVGTIWLALTIIAVVIATHLPPDIPKTVQKATFLLVTLSITAVLSGYIYMQPVNIVDARSVQLGVDAGLLKLESTKTVAFETRNIETKVWFTFENYVLYFNKSKNRYCMAKYNNKLELCGSRFSRIASWLH